MGITKCNTMDAIWLLGLRCPDDFAGDGVSDIPFNTNVIFNILSTNDI